MNRILVFELNWLGDILFSVPLLRAIKERYPSSRVACVVVPRYASLLRGIPYADACLELSDRRGLFAIPEKTSFVKRARNGHFDTCFFLKPSVTKTAMALGAGIQNRIGFKGKTGPGHVSFALTIEADVPPGKIHRIDQLLLLANGAGINVKDAHYEFFVKKEDEKKAGDILANARRACPGRKTIVVNPGANWPAKRWPPENFGALIKKILSGADDIEVVVTGSSDDRSLAAGIVKNTDSSRVFSIVGLTDLCVLAALFKKSEVVISADSGPMHLASAVGAKVVALFGPTSPEVTGPRGRGRSVVLTGMVDCEVPCYLAKCGRGYECMRSITVEKVTKAVFELTG